MNWSKVFSAAVLLAFVINSLHGNDRIMSILMLTESVRGDIDNLTLTYGKLCQCENNCGHPANFKPFNINGNKNEILRKIYDISGEYFREIDHLTKKRQSKKVSNGSLLSVLSWLHQIHKDSGRLLNLSQTDGTKTTNYIYFPISKCNDTIQKKCYKKTYNTICGLGLAKRDIIHAVNGIGNKTTAPAEKWKARNSKRHSCKKPLRGFKTKGTVAMLKFVSNATMMFNRKNNGR